MLLAAVHGPEDRVALAEAARAVTVFGHVRGEVGEKKFRVHASFVDPRTRQDAPEREERRVTYLRGVRGGARLGSLRFRRRRVRSWSRRCETTPAAPRREAAARRRSNRAARRPRMHPSSCPAPAGSVCRSRRGHGRTALWRSLRPMWSGGRGVDAVRRPLRRRGPAAVGSTRYGGRGIDAARSGDRSVDAIWRPRRRRGAVEGPRRRRGASAASRRRPLPRLRGDTRRRVAARARHSRATLNSGAPPPGPLASRRASPPSS